MRANDFGHTIHPQFFYFFWIAAWVAIVFISWHIRPIAPIDETRYVGTAWEMWVNHNWIVLTVDGHTYGNKAPLLYWLILFGWKILGVNNWWPRLVPALFSLMSLFALKSLAKKMFPQHVNFQYLAPTFLLGIFYWGFFTQRLMFDIPLIFFTILCYIGLFKAIKNNSGWLLFIISLSIGILLKGPVIFVYVLFPALFAPYWLKNESIKWGKWYFSVLLALFISLAILLTWVGLAMKDQGAFFGKNLLLNQIIGRMSGHFGHARPWWYYFTIIPGMILPWLLWIPFWRSLPIILHQKHTRIVRFCFSILIPGLIFFIFFVNTKQGRYLLPFYPAFSILFAYAFTKYSRKITRSDQLLLILMLLITGIGLLLVPHFPNQFAFLNSLEWIKNISPLWATIIIVLALVLWHFYKKNIYSQASIIALMSVSLNLIYFLGIMHHLTPFYDLTKPAKLLSQADKKNLPIANVDRYQDEFTFLARLKHPVYVISSEQIKTWASTHPNGWIIDYAHGISPKKINPKPTYWQPYEDKKILILWKASAFDTGNI